MPFDADQSPEAEYAEFFTLKTVIAPSLWPHAMVDPIQESHGRELSLAEDPMMVAPAYRVTIVVQSS